MNKTINCLVIDDEPLARELISTFLSGKEDFAIVGQCADAVSAYELLLNNPVDVIFLDIQMPVISGVDFLRSLRHPPKIVFATAYAQHAADAFNLNVVDYLVKPVTAERFSQALDKIRVAMQKIDAGPAEKTLPENIGYTFFKVDGRLVKISFEEIIYLEALKDFTKIFLRDKKQLLIGDHLKAVEMRLPAGQFVRIHRSYIVSMAAVTGISGNMVDLADTQLPIGGSYKEQVFQLLNIHQR